MDEKHKRFAVKLMYVAAGAAVFYLVFNYLWGVILPFAAAYVLAECFKPLIRYSEKHEKFPKKTIILLVLIAASCAIAMLIFAAARELVHETTDLIAKASGLLTRIRDDDEFASGIIDGICSLFPFADLHDRLWEIRPEIDEKLLSALISSADTIGKGALDLAGNAVSVLPGAVLGFIVTIISAYYFAVDRVRINAFFLRLFPEKTRPALKRIKDEFFGTVANFLRAYGLIFLITFAELFVSFNLIGVDYSFVIALATAIVDILPVLGTGFVLVPWAAVTLISGNTGRGIALLAVFGVITVVRQVIEPKIVGKFIGLSPLAALATMYAGLKLCGVAGLFLFPLGFLVVQNAVTEKPPEQVPEASERR